MRKLLSMLLVLSMVLSFGIPAMAADTPKSDDIVILYTNDVHTYIDGNLSYDVIAALKQKLQEEYNHVLLVDAGDHIQGTAFGSMDKGKTVIDLMNAAGYDLATLGNHEFDYTMEGRINVTDVWAEFPYVCCNFYYEENGVRGENVLDSYEIFDCGDTDVAIVGILTPSTMTSSTPAYFQDDDGSYIYGISGGEDGSALYGDVQAAIDAATSEGAEIVLALGHLGVETPGDPWGSVETIENVSGLDAFIDGHSHTIMEGDTVYDKDGEAVLLTQTGEYFGRIGMMVIDSETGEIETDFIEYDEAAGAPSSELYTGTEVLSDSAVDEIKTAWIASVNTQLGEKIGTAEVTFDNYDEDGIRLVRAQETNSGDFSADALYYLFDGMSMDVDVAVMNGGGVRNKAITGELSYLSCKEIHTFGNVACLLTVTGQQILDALEWGSRNAGVGEEGSFLHVSGLTYKVDTSVADTTQQDDKGVWTGGPEEYRVHDVKVYNKETDGWDALELDKKYNLAGYNYTLRDLGGGFAMFDGAVNVLDYVMEDYMVLANYVKAFEDCTVKADNSPLLAKYPSFLLDYSEVLGSGRIEVGAEKVSPQLYVDGVNALETSSGEGWSYDKETNTLTLSGAEIDTGYAYFREAEDVRYAGIYAVGDLRVVLTENTESTLALKETDAQSSYGVYVSGDLTVTGSGKLKVTSGSAVVESMAIRCDGKVTINESNVYADAGIAGADSYSIGLEAETIEMKGGFLGAKGAGAGSSIGIYVYGDAMVEAGTLEISGGSAGASAGMYVEGDMQAVDCGLFANGSEGLVVFGKLSFTDSYVDIKTGEVTGEDGISTGINCGNGAFTNSNVYVTSAGDGILVQDLTVEDGTLTVTAGGNGIYTESGSVVLDCGDVGMSTVGSPRLTGTRVNINADGAYGIYAATLEISERLVISTPGNGSVQTAADEYGKTIADQQGTAALSLGIEPLGYTIHVRGLNNAMAFKVPAGKSANDVYCERFGVEDISELLNTRKDGYIFVGWYTDEACTAGNEFRFDMPMTGDVTIYPKWICDGGQTCPSGSFVDLSKDAWYHESVDFALNNDLMIGMGNNRFAPEDTTSRAMFVTILWRLNGQPEAETENSFRDVQDGAWYEEPVKWAAENGIVLGIGGGYFDPNGDVTREQAAVMMQRYAAYKGLDTSASAELSQFPDDDEVSVWAERSMKWAVGEGLIIGVRNNGVSYLEAKDDSTRAEIATMLQRYYQFVF